MKTETQTDAARIAEYLREHGYNSPREIASDLGMGEAQYSMAVRDIPGYRSGIRPDSYGHSVAWLA